MKKNLPYIALILLFVSCNNTDRTLDKGYYVQDFEFIKGWDCCNEGAHKITDEKAQSGKYSSKMSVGSEFSPAFVMPLSEIKSNRYKKVSVRAWGMISELSSDATLVISFEGTSKAVVWEGKKFNSFLNTPDKWGEINNEFTIGGLKDSVDLLLKIYAHNPDSSAAYLDNMQVEFKN